MLKKITILVIEDARLVRELVRAILSKTGYVVVEADSGEIGLAMVIEHRPDVVLVDVLLAGEMDGLTVCHEIRSISGLENTPVIIMSSLSQEADLAAGRLYGANDYLTKPINSEILLSRIASVLEPRGDNDGH
jgi:DNA-binding response OmpR family regulator